MCVISMIHDRYRRTWPVLPGTIVPGTGTAVEPWVPDQIKWTPTQEKTALDAFEELCAAARKLDEILGLPDCEDPKKAEWLESVRQRVREHELKKIDERLK